MNTRILVPTLLGGLCLLAATTLALADSWPADGARPTAPRQDPADALEAFEVRAADDVDEALFLMRVLERSFEQWPDWALDSDHAANWALEQRTVLAQLRRHAASAGLGGDVLAALDAALLTFASHDDYLVEIGAASREVLERAQRERGALVERGVRGLVDRAVDGEYAGEGGGERVVTDALSTAVVGGLIELWNSSERDAAERRRAAAAERAFRASREQARLNVARTALRLSAARGWRKGEVGFDSLGARGQLGRRPRDPFARLANAEIRVEGEQAADLLRDARECVLAARYVPDGAPYDRFRGEMLAGAGRLSARAASAAWFAGQRYAYGGDIAREGVRICRTRLLYDPDPSGLGAYELAQCLHFAGLHEEALEAAVRAKGQFRKPGFAYDFACLSSVNGLTQQALEWLEFAFALGNTSVAWAQEDPDLANLREALPGEFAELVGVRLSASIVWGVFNDDYTLTNNSKFTVTNVAVEPVIVLDGRQVTQRLTAARIAPGETHTWTNAFSINPDKFVRLEFGEWSCDQL